ncbi:hypothetical protein [Aeromonas phage L9-6]|nr:hypothetical protein [Aeromonas phage L9-6]
MKYATYITIYSGNRLPPFYIGSSTVKRINSGYFGSVLSKVYKKIWQYELKNSPELFDIIILDTFESRKEALDAELILHKRHTVHKNPLFVNMSYAAPNGYYGRDTSGKNHPLYGSHNCKDYFHSHNPTNGEMFFKDYLPAGCVRGRPAGNGAHNKGRRTWNNGKINKMSINCPGDDWVLGRINTIGVNSSVRGDAWKSYNVLYELWIKLGKPSGASFKNYAVKQGYPNQTYMSMVTKFKEEYYENSALR